MVSVGGFRVSVQASTQSATIWSDEDKPVATLQRRRVYAPGPAWRMYDLRGREIGDGFTAARKALVALASDILLAH